MSWVLDKHDWQLILIVACCLLYGWVSGYAAGQEVPPRKNMAVVEVALMAEDCLWLEPKQSLTATLLCVRDKIDMRLEQLAEGNDK